MVDNWVPPARRDTRALAREIDDTIRGRARPERDLPDPRGVLATTLWLIGLNHGAMIGLAVGSSASSLISAR